MNLHHLTLGIYWGCRRIADELGKLGIDIHHTTVNKIIQDFRKSGEIAASGSWTRFLKANWDSLYGMDFMTIDTIFGKRFYLLIVLGLSTLEIKYRDITENPNKEFVRQRIIEIQDQDPGEKYLIHDNALQFTLINYPAYGIEGVRTSVGAPNMKTKESECSGQVYLAIAELTMGATTVNAYVERVIGTIRREAFDHFFLVSERRVRNIISKYVHYYNRYRPHQGLGRIPAEQETVDKGIVLKMPILSGLQRGYDYGQSRVICNVHWQSDVDAGRVIGAAVVARLHANPDFQSDLTRAKEEVLKMRSDT